MARRVAARSFPSFWFDVVAPLAHPFSLRSLLLPVPVNSQLHLTPHIVHSLTLSVTQQAQPVPQTIAADKVLSSRWMPSQQRVLPQRSLSRTSASLVNSLSQCSVYLRRRASLSYSTTFEIPPSKRLPCHQLSELLILRRATSTPQQSHPWPPQWSFQRTTATTHTSSPSSSRLQMALLPSQLSWPHCWSFKPTPRRKLSSTACRSACAGSCSPS